MTPPAADATAIDDQHPWLGLASFSEETLAYFYGREDEVAELARRVQRKLLTVLFGQSGLGKTSILRAGIVSLPGGQREAALAVGLTPGQTLRLILLPQAVRRMLPSLVSQLVVLLKDTSLGFVVGYAELLRTSRELRDFFGSRYIFSIFLVTAVIYIGVNFALSRVATYLERRGTSKAAGGVARQVVADGRNA